MIDKVKLLAHFGLFCGDCAGFSGDVASTAKKLKETLVAYNFEKTASVLFSKPLKDYDKFYEMLSFITTLKCENICRNRPIDESSCEIRKCSIQHGYYACYECDIFEKCEKLQSP